jgi:hypothetical protein
MSQSPAECAPRAARRTRRGWRVVLVALLLVAGVHCSRSERRDVAPAERIVVGPREAGVVAITADGALRRFSAAGLEVAQLAAQAAHSPHVVFEIPSDVEDRAATAPIVLFHAAPGEINVARVSRWRVDGSLAPIVDIELAEGESAAPRVSGSRRDGATEAGFMTVVVESALGIRRVLRIELATGAVQPWTAEIFDERTAFVSVAPQGDALVALREVGDSRELVLARHGDASTRTFSGVESVKPYWLVDVPALLFVRTGGSVARVMLPDQEPEWLTGGTFTTEFARDEVTSRIGDDQRVTVEKIGFDGFAQICELAPFELDGAREKQLTSGSVDHYGSAWSSDHRFLAYRQRERGSADETIVVIDRVRDYRAETLATRRVAALADGIGPAFVSGTYRLLLVLNGRLVMFDLAPGESPPR